MSGRDVLEATGLTKEDLARLKTGEIVTRPALRLNDKDLGLLVAAWFDAPVKRVAEYVRVGRWLDVLPDVEAKAVLGPDADASSMAGVGLDFSHQDEGFDLLDAEPGDVFNLSSAEIRAFRELPRSFPSIEAMLRAVSGTYRRIMLERLRAYRCKGLAGVAPYDRGDGERTRPGNELAEATSRDPLLSRFFPEFHKLLASYPAPLPEGVHERFYLTREVVEDRPTMVLKHVLLSELDAGAVVCIRQFYVGHSYNCMQITFGAASLDGGVLLLFRNHTFTDQVTGFAASLRRKLGLEQMRQEVVREFELVRDDFFADP